MKIIIASLCAVVALSACDSKSGSGLMTFDPPSLKSCDVASEVTVKWDVRNKYPEVQAVQLYVIDGVSETVFSLGGPVGESKTGLWVRPGIPKFLLKDKVSGKTLDEASVDGPKCKQ